ncbi:aminotransferase class I/II-fold pyridoxal phosphate-dependent enzyme [Brevibacterium antiquum]
MMDMSPSFSATALAALLPDPPGISAHSIASDLTLLIRRGEIPIGAKLPPVRALAQELWVSPGTVSSAWKTLKGRGVLEGQGRAGVTVVKLPDTPRPERYEANRPYAPEVRLDLGASSPDPALLPSLKSALSHLPEYKLNSYERDRIVPNLQAAATDDWPYSPRSMMAVNGGYDGLRLILQTFVSTGDWVLVENPTPPRVLDLVHAAGARMQFLPRDAEGVIPEALEAALDLQPAAIILQPGIHNPIGTVMSKRRSEELVVVLNRSSVLVIEDDGAGALFAGAVNPLASRLSCPHLYVRSYSKSHGPDLRLAVIEGPDETVTKVHAFFGYGAGWVSRALQEALAWLLRDDDTRALIRQARDIYDHRRAALSDALCAAGVSFTPGYGLDLLIPVRDEGYAQGVLAAHGILISRGSNFTPDRHHAAWIRVATSVLSVDSAEEIARLITQAAH